MAKSNFISTEDFAQFYILLSDLESFIGLVSDLVTPMDDTPDGIKVVALMNAAVRNINELTQSIQQIEEGVSHE